MIQEWESLANKKQLGQRLKELRENADITQLDLSLSAGCSKNYISALERGINKLTVPMLLEYCKALHLTPNDVLNYSTDSRLSEIQSILQNMDEKGYQTALRILRAL